MSDISKVLNGLEFLLLGEGLNILTSKDVGALGNIERHRIENSDLRTFVEFEITIHSRCIWQ